MNLGAALAVIRCYDGCQGYLEIFRELCIEPKHQFITLLEEKDRKRLSHSITVAKESVKGIDGDLNVVRN